MDSLSKRESLEYRPVSLSFACSVLASSRNNTLHESSKMYVEHARHVASDRTQSGSPYTRVLSTAGSVMTISKKTLTCDVIIPAHRQQFN